MAITAKLRQAIFDRDGRKCVACNSASNLTIQHRVSKGMGGSKLYDTFPYLITMCQPCNVGLESNYELAEQGRFNGWKLSRNTRPPVNPEEVPVKIGATWFYLDSNGGKTPITRR
jgi:5-methylcytosine-specific restriction endonuclease McrA